MNKPLLIAILIIIALIGALMSLWMFGGKEFERTTNERNAMQRQADSLRTVNAQLSDSVEVHKLNASKANAIADSLMKTDPQVIVDERVKLNRYATAEKVGEGLVKQLP